MSKKKEGSFDIKLYNVTYISNENPRIFKSFLTFLLKISSLLIKPSKFNKKIFLYRPIRIKF